MQSTTALVPKSEKWPGIFQFLALGTGTLNSIGCGMHYGWASPSLPKLLHNDSDIPITSGQGSWIAIMLPIGAICGAVLSATLTDRIGRKNLILTSGIPFFVSWMFLAFAWSLPLLLVGRLVAGIANGLTLSILPMYLGEIADPKVRGFMISWISVMWLLGVLLMNVIGSYLSIRNAALVASAVPVIFLLTFSWMPESPYSLIMKGRFDQARRNLQTFKGQANVDEELDRLKQAVEKQTRNTGKYLDLFTETSNRRALGIAIGARTAQQLGGTTAIMFYAQIIFKAAGDTVSPTIASIIYFAVQLLFSGFSSTIVDKAGRKPLMLISIAGSGLALLAEGCYFYLQSATNVDVTNIVWVPIAALIVYVVMFSMGMRTIPVLLAGELFPTNVKSFALSFCNCYYFVLAAAVCKLFQITKDEFGMHVPFLTFSACSAVGLLFVIFCIFETKGRTLEQIQQELGSTTLRNRSMEESVYFRKLPNST